MKQSIKILEAHNAIKTCKTCKKEKPIENYCRHSRNKDGHNSVCKECALAATYKWQLLHPEKLIESRSTYHQKNKAKRNADNAEYRASNIEIEKARCAEYRANNIEKEKIRAQKYRENNKEKESARQALYSKTHPEIIRIKAHNRRSRVSYSGGSLSKDLAEKLFTLQRGKCPCCGELLGNDYHLDHKMPLALGGDNIDSNMQLLRAKCNMQKSAKHPIDFMQSRGFLL